MCSSDLAEIMNIPIIGLVENMAYLRCPDCKKEISVFGESHIGEIADEHGINLVAKMPIDPKIASACDKGLIEECEIDYLEDILQTLDKME